MTEDKNEILTTNQRFRAMMEEEHKHRFGRNAEEDSQMAFIPMLVFFVAALYLLLSVGDLQCLMK